MDQSKKTMRHFYCRDVMWETFEQMANDFDCSIDYLINEAMRQYAREKNYGVSGGVPSPGYVPGPGDVRRPPPPPAPHMMQHTPYQQPPQQGHQAHNPYQQPPPQQQAPPEPDFPTLFLIYNGQRFSIVKDQFIIGRGSKTSDLAIKDGNISRKHAAVIRRNGTYYIKDLGSTNGIDFEGMRIDNKRIDEGDIFHICDYELRFTYQ